MLKFSHRNGETENPTVDGFYWKFIQTLPDGDGFFTIDEWRKGRWEHWENTLQIVPLFGPIPMPEKI